MAVPVTRDNYLELAGLPKNPDPELEAEIPPELQVNPSVYEEQKAPQANTGRKKPLKVFGKTPKQAGNVQ